MATRISPQAAQLVKPKGLDLETLTEAQRAALHGRDAVATDEVSAAEAAAALKVADLNQDGFVDPAEAEQLRETLDDKAPIPAQYQGQRLQARAKAVQSELQVAVTGAQRRYDAAASALGAGEQPNASLEQLRAQRQTLPSDAEVATLQASVTAHQKIVTEVPPQLTALDQQLALIKKSPDFFDASQKNSLRANYESTIAHNEALLQKYGNSPETLQADVFDARREVASLKRSARPSLEQLNRLQAAESQLHELEHFDPKLAKDITQNCKDRLEKWDATTKKYESLLGQREALGAKLAAANQALPGDEAKLATTTATKALLDKQLEFLGAKKELADVKTQAATVDRLSSTVASQEEQGLAAERMKERIAVATKRIATEVPAALEQMAEAQQNAKNLSGYPMQQLALLHKLKDDVAAGKLKGKDVDLHKVDQSIAQYEKSAQLAGQRIEAAATSIITQLQGPDFMAAVKAMPEDQQAPLLEKMLKALEGTQAGEKFINENVLPALQNQAGAPAAWKDLLIPKEAVGVPTNSALREAVLDVKGAAAKVRTSMTVLGAAGWVIAKRADATAVLDASMKASLALRGGKDLDLVAKAALMAKAGDAEGASKLLKESGLGRLAGNLKGIGQAAGSIGSLIAVSEVFRDPNFRSAVGAGKGAAELMALGGQLLATEGSKWAQFGKAAGVAGPLLGAVVGGYDTYQAAQRGDQGAAVGNSLVTTGGIVAAAGLALDGTGIGAVAGVPLNIIGGTLAAVGAGVNYFFGDSDTEKFLKANDLWLYSKDYQNSVR